MSPELREMAIDRVLGTLSLPPDANPRAVVGAVMDVWRLSRMVGENGPELKLPNVGVVVDGKVILNALLDEKRNRGGEGLGLG